MKKDKKIIILLMCHKDTTYEKNAEALKKSYKKLINKYKLNNYINIFSYTGNNDIQQINENTIDCVSSDDIEHTYDKTIECFDIVNKNFDYDYLVRTNCSQIINIKLLYEYLIRENDKPFIYVGELTSSPGYTVINKADINIAGNFMVFHKNMIKSILKYVPIVNELKQKHPQIGTNGTNTSDDIMISAILMIMFNTDNYRWRYLDNIKCVDQGFYMCYDCNKPYEGTDLCNWHNDSLNFDYMKHFISIRMKPNTPHPKSIVTKINELCQMYLDNDDNNIDETINKINHWAENPNVHTDWWNQCIYTKLNNLIHKIKI